MNRTLGSILIFILGIGVGLIAGFGVSYVTLYNAQEKNVEVVESQKVEENVSVEKEQETNVSETKNLTDYMFSDSSTKNIDESKLEGLSKFELEIAKNEIFARYGYDFSSATLREYFSRKTWYNLIPGKKIAVTELNQVEQENIYLIDKYLAKINAQ